MNSYNDFAYVYDKLIGQDYEAWADCVEQLFKKSGVSPKLVLDLGCGTGSITNILAKRGYDMIGVDLSYDMLGLAKQKADEEGLDVLYLCQDIRSFELYGTVDAVICTLDVLNYITDKDELSSVFALVKNYLNPGGVFIFDINTTYKLSTVLGNNTFVNDEEGVFYVWENEYKDRLSSQYLTFFVQSDDVYERFDEEHFQRAYDIEEIEALLRQNGFETLTVSTPPTLEKPDKNSEKVIILSKSLC